MRTPWHNQALARLRAATWATPYEAMGDAVAEYHERAAQGATASDVATVARAIERALFDPAPKTRYRIGRGSGMAMALPHLIPNRTFDAMLRQQFRLPATISAR